MYLLIQSWLFSVKINILLISNPKKIIEDSSRAGMTSNSILIFFFSLQLHQR